MKESPRTMRRHFPGRSFAAVWLILVGPAELLAANAYVGAMSGRIFKVPPSGVAQLIAQLPNPIGAISRSPDGVLFVCANATAPRIFAVAESGSSTEISASLPSYPCGDSVFSADRRLFVLLRRSPSEADEIWEVMLDGSGSHRVVNLAGALFPDGGVLGMTLGNGGDFFLPTQEQSLGRVLRATRHGTVSVHFAPYPPLNLLVDAAADSTGALFILSQAKVGPNPNNRSVLKLQGGLLTTVAGSEVVGGAAGRVSVGDAGEIFVLGGGFGGGDPVAYVQRILPGVGASILATFPNETTTALDDDRFEGFVVGKPTQVAIVSSPFSMAGIVLVATLLILLAQVPGWPRHTPLPRQTDT